MVPRVLQITENELCREHRNLDDHQNNLCIAVLSIIPLRKTFYFWRRLCLFRVAFKNIQGLLCKIQGLVKRCQGYPTIFQFSRTFQGHHAFSMTFQGPCEPWLRSGLIKQRPSSNVQLTVLYISLSSVHDYNMKMPNVTFCGERKEAYTIFSFSF